MNSNVVLFAYEAGDTVYYDGVFEKDGHTWISYISYSGVRRFVKID